MPETTVIDGGYGNLFSLMQALRRIGQPATLTQDPEMVRSADRLILPGVGAFGDAMNSLDRLGLREAIGDYVATGRPFLGICVGMQLLLDSSEESPGVRGLCLIPGQVKRVTGVLKVPHMGWNVVSASETHPARRMIPHGEYLYFVHSYHCVPEDSSVVAGVTEYGAPLAAVLQKENIIAAQFHPEKSQDAGEAFLRGFFGWRP